MVPAGVPGKFRRVLITALGFALERKSPISGSTSAVLFGCVLASALAIS